MLTKPKQEAHFVKDSIPWKQFRAIAHAFDGIPLVRLNYCEGTLEIMPISLRHESIVMLLNTLLMNYFAYLGIRFTATGAHTQSVPPHTEFQADLSFTFGDDQEVSDLCIEVVITSGSINKLRKYELRGVPEVWFWENGKISVFVYQNGAYHRQTQSNFLPDLDIPHLESCLLMESQLEAMRTFHKRYA